MVETAAAETVVAQDALLKAQKEVQAAQQAAMAAQNRVADAQSALADYGTLTWCQFEQKFSATCLDTMGGIIDAVISHSAGGLFGGIKEGVSMFWDTNAFGKNELQRKIKEAEDAAAVGQTNWTVADASVRIAEASETLAALKEDLARNLLDFDTNHREFGQSTWSRMADEMSDIVRFRLLETLRLAYLAQRAAYLVTSVEYPIVSFDRQPNTASGLLALLNQGKRDYLLGEKLKVALAQLDSQVTNWWNQPDHQQGLVEEVWFDQGSSIYTLDPFQWLQFQLSGGDLDFELTLPQLDSRTAGLFERYIDEVAVVGQVGNIGSQGTIVGRLSNSQASVERVMDPLSKVPAADQTPDWVAGSDSLGFRCTVRVQNLQTLVFQSHLQPNSDFEIAVLPDTKLLRTFEYNGLTQRWKLQILAQENPTLTFSSIVSLGVRFRYSARNSPPLAALVAPAVAALPANRTLLYVLFASGFTTVGRDRTATRLVRPEDLQGTPAGKMPMLVDVGCAFVPKPGVTIPPLLIHLSCDAYTGSDGRPVDVVATTDTRKTAGGINFQVALGNSQDVSSKHPFAVFGDKVRTDNVAMPWLALLSGPPSARHGVTFNIRMNLDENASFSFADFDYCALYLFYVLV